MDETIMKGHWVIPADYVTIIPTKEDYPVTIFCNDHKFIEQMEIPNENYINVKIYGRWATLYLPSQESFERSDSLKFNDSE